MRRFPLSILVVALITMAAACDERAADEKGAEGGPTPAEELARFDVGGPPSQELVKQYEVALDDLDRRCTASAADLADFTIEAHQRLSAENQAKSPLNGLREMKTIFPDQTLDGVPVTENPECKEILFAPDSYAAFGEFFTP